LRGIGIEVVSAALAVFRAAGERWVVTAASVEGIIRFAFE
jgi:hypothetical protein